MIASDLRRLIIREVARAGDGGSVHWAKVIGQVKVYPKATHAHCNWEVRLSGSVRDMATAEQALDMIQARHPFVEDE